MDRTTLVSRSYTGLPLPEQLPRVATLHMPSMPLTAGVSGLGDTSTGITPTDLTQRLPSIVNPVPVQASPCNSIAEWIDGNTVWAVVGLAALAWFALKD